MADKPDVGRSRGRKEFFSWATEFSERLRRTGRQFSDSTESDPKEGSEEEGDESMTDLLVRNIDPSIAEEIREEAKETHRTLQAQVTTILEEWARLRSRKREFLERAAALREQTRGTHQTDSAILRHEGRRGE